MTIASSRSRLAVTCLPAAWLLLAATAAAQWSPNPGANLAVGDAASDQNQPKVVAAPDGGTYVSWLDGIGSGWDVRLQKLDAYGNELWPHNGVLVADRNYSSTQDYGLDVDASGNALLAFRDDAFAPEQISAAKVTPDGALAWGPGHVQASSTTQFVAAPSITGDGLGNVIVSWTENTSIKIRKLDASGAPQWQRTLAPGAGSYSVCDSHADSGGGVIVSFVHQLGGFGTPRHLLAVKYDTAGAFQWQVTVFDGGSLQFGNFPDFHSDGAGGGVFSWYDTATFQLNVYAQHVLADGTEAFGHNGVLGSTDVTRLRVSPSTDHDPATGETVMFWTELNSSQTMGGVFGQKFDAAGNRLWGPNGAGLFPLVSSSIGWVTPKLHKGGAFVFWTNAVNPSVDLACVGRMNADGTIDMGAYDASTVGSNKTRMVVARNAAGNHVLAWSDDRSDGGDIYVQNVDCDGDFGPSSWVDLGNGLAGTAGTPSLIVDGTLTQGCPLMLHLGDTLPSTLVFLVAGVAPVNLPFHGGTLVPAFEAPLGTFILLPTGPSGSISLATPWPGGMPGGTNLFLQVWLKDAGAAQGFAASNARRGQVP